MKSWNMGYPSFSVTTFVTQLPQFGHIHESSAVSWTGLHMMIHLTGQLDERYWEALDDLAAVSKGSPWEEKLPRYLGKRDIQEPSPILPAYLATWTDAELEDFFRLFSRDP